MGHCDPDSERGEVGGAKTPEAGRGRVAVFECVQGVEKVVQKMERAR